MNVSAPKSLCLTTTLVFCIVYVCSSDHPHHNFLRNYVRIMLEVQIPEPHDTSTESLCGLNMFFSHSVDSYVH